MFYNKIVRLMQLVLLVTISSILFGCSSSSTESGIQYYSLNPINVKQEKPSIENNINTAFMVVNNIEMADFLNTGGLVMQLSSHQIQISNQHLWADKLSKAISKNIIQGLSNNNKNIYVERQNAINTSLADITLNVSIEQFTITNNHETIISGFYHLESGLNNQDKAFKQSRKAFFDIRQPLVEDGYNHAISTFIKSLDELSNTILLNLPKY